MAESATAPPVETPVPQDTDDTRGIHFKRLLQRPVTLSLGSTLAIAAFVVGTLVAGLAIGALAALGALLLTVLIVYLLASGKAKEDFFSAYSAARELTREKKGSLPGGTPLLRRGDDRYGRDSDGHRQTTYSHFTVVLAEIPESAPRVGELYVQRRVGFRFLDSAEDFFRTRERITLESEELDQQAEIFAGRNEDQNWIRQLFAPSFVHWLGDDAPDGFAFELVGLLCVNVKGHHDSAVELDALCEAAGVVASRIREESLEAAPSA